MCVGGEGMGLVMHVTGRRRGRKWYDVYGGGEWR